MIDFMIFSKNRPMQLHALLSSMKLCVKGDHSMTVLCKYDDQFVSSLNQIQEEFPNIKIIHEDDFRSHVTDFLSGGGLCSFLVDDNVFKDEVDLNQIADIMKNNDPLLCFSLRLGLHLTKCYTMNVPQRIPDGFTQFGIFLWDWRMGEYDWNYPLSVDGHVFRKSELLALTSMITFKNPNQYEAGLHFLTRSVEIKATCACYTFSKLINVPLNKVQNEFNNRNEGVSIDKMLELWNNEQRLKPEMIYQVLNESAHFVVDMGLSE